LQEELAPLKTPTLTNTTAGIVPPTIREEKEVQTPNGATSNRRTSAEASPSDWFRTVSTPTNQAQVFNTLTLKNINHFHISYQKNVPTIGII
jgi:hypothetical protein